MNTQNNKKNISEAVLQKITTNKITPKAKHYFTVKKIALWISISLTILFGALTTSVSIFFVRASDFMFRNEIDQSLPRALASLIPSFWLCLLVLSTLLLYIEFRQTEGGYKYQLPLVIGGIIIVSVSSGTILHSIGIGKRIDKITANTFPSYKEAIHQKRMDRWQQPEKGLLSGKITQINIPATITITDFTSHEWQIILQQNRPLPPFIQLDQTIRVTGQQINENSFKADRLAPWEHNLHEAIPPFKDFLKENKQPLRTR